LGGASSQIQERIYNYGKYLGLAFQIIDDVLDFTGKGLVLGKPIGQDLELGLCTAPVYYASLEYPELENYIKRNFSVEGDVDLVKDLVLKSNGLEKSKDLAKWFCHKARNELDILKDSEAKEMLIELTETVITRTK
jgi:hexaprenyl-diphosphate synthase